MADNTTLPTGVGGDTVRTIDKSGNKTQVVTLDVGGAGAEALLAGTVPVSGTVVVSSSALATATAEGPAYTEGAASAFSQDLEGNLRTRISAKVNDSPQAYVDGDIQPLSLNSEGRLRVSVVPAANYLEFFVPFNFGKNVDILELSTSPWSALL